MNQANIQHFISSFYQLAKPKRFHPIYFFKAKLRECKAGSLPNCHLHLESALLYLKAGMPKKAADMLVMFSNLNPDHKARILKIAADLYFLSKSWERWASTFCDYIESLGRKVHPSEKIYIQAAATSLASSDFASAAALLEAAARLTFQKQRKMTYLIEAEKLYAKAGLKQEAERIYNATLFVLYSE